jgi:hypothetical protein
VFVLQVIYVPVEDGPSTIDDGNRLRGRNTGSGDPSDAMTISNGAKRNYIPVMLVNFFVPNQFEMLEICCRMP